MSQKFSPSEDEMLVEQVREYRCIYDHQHKDFKDYQIRENIWNAIGKVLSKNADECKSRWKSIRDNYMKHKRRPKCGTGSAASRRPIKWPLYDYLTFLEDVNSQRSRIQNTEDNNLSMDSDSDLESEQPAVNIDDDIRSPESTSSFESKKRNLNIQKKSRSDTPMSGASTSNITAKTKLLNNIEQRSKDRLHLLSQLTKQKEDNDVDLFMRSIALTVKRLPPNLISQAKLQILTLVTNLEATSGITSNITAAQVPGPNSSTVSTFGDCYNTSTDYYNM